MAAENIGEEVDQKKLREEKKKLQLDKKQQKKEAKKRAKEIAAQEHALAEEEETGGIFTFLATVAIVAVWLGIIAIIIKLDVGGFGSGVLTPILKDVPVVNKILPSTEREPAQVDETEGYGSLEDTVAQLKQLEKELEAAQGNVLSKDEEIANLKAEVERLGEFEDRQVEFQRIKTEFYEEVIYADKGPGADEYRKYYEEIDSTTAEYLYKQVVKQLEESKEVQEYAQTYAEMKPKQAAGIFEGMADNLTLVARILNLMSAEDRGAILGVMDSEVAGKLTKIMDPES